MKNWICIAQGYDGAFAEFMFALYNEDNVLKLKDLSFHYNANKETLLAEYEVPSELKSYYDVLRFIVRKIPKRYQVDVKFLEGIKKNKELMDFVMNSF